MQAFATFVFVALTAYTFEFAVTAPQMSTQPATHHTNIHHHSHHGHPNTTKEPYERENFWFTYSGITHRMYIRTTPDHNCYIANLAPSETQTVHTDSGLKALELKFLRLLNYATKIPTNSSTLKHQDHRICGTHFTNYYLVVV